MLDISGLILYELHCANVEKLRRASLKEEFSYVPLENEVRKKKCTLLCYSLKYLKNFLQAKLEINEDILMEAMRILKNDVAAPNDYHEICAAKSLISCKA
jgi:hypothetical protein